MKQIFNIGLLLCLFSYTASSTEFLLPKYDKFELKNGLTVYLLEQHEVPLVDVTFTVKAGAIADTKAGLAKITAENLLLGTQNLEKDLFEQTLDFVGAEIDSTANLERTVISASFARDNINDILPLIAETVLTPAFKEAEFEKHKTRYLSQLEQRQESPRQVIKSYFDALLYQDHPYANQVNGNTNSVPLIQLNDIEAFHSKWYTPGNSALVIAGDFDSKNLKRKVKKLLGQWKGKAISPAISSTLPTHQSSQVLLVNKPDATETRFFVGNLGVKRSNPDFTAISVINTVLGARFSSWLNDELRINSGLTYGAGSQFDTKALGGSFYMSTFTQTETTEETIDLLLKTYARLWEKGIDQTTLDLAKSYIKGRYPTRFETSKDLASLLSDMFVYEYDEQRINTFSERVDQLDLAKSKEIIERYFPKDNLQFAVIGKAETIKQKLEKYGSVKVVEITDSTIKL
jgi:predicted Zn-dependent peptidase